MRIRFAEFEESWKEMNDHPLTPPEAERLYGIDPRGFKAAATYIVDDLVRRGHVRRWARKRTITAVTVGMVAASVATQKARENQT